jgi:hypothetical protein
MDNTNAVYIEFCFEKGEIFIHTYSSTSKDIHVDDIAEFFSGIKTFLLKYVKEKVNPQLKDIFLEDSRGVLVMDYNEDGEIVKPKVALVSRKKNPGANFKWN